MAPSKKAKRSPAKKKRRAAKKIPVARRKALAKTTGAKRKKRSKKAPRAVSRDAAKTKSRRSAAGVRDADAVELLGDTNAALAVPADEALVEIAERWSRQVIRRQRWKTTALEKMRVQVLDDVSEWYGDDQSRALELFLKENRLIEVGIPAPADDGEDAWKARVAPWEYLLSTAKREVVESGSLRVVRRIDRAGKPGRRAFGNQKVLFVISAPGAAPRILRLRRRGATDQGL